jgi:hypothetical protein
LKWFGYNVVLVDGLTVNGQLNWASNGH